MSNNHVVKFLVDDTGEVVKNDKWHYVYSFDGDSASLCTGEVFAMAGSRLNKSIDRTGKITCPKCIEIIKHFKAIKL